MHGFPVYVRISATILNDVDKKVAYAVPQIMAVQAAGHTTPVSWNVEGTGVFANVTSEHLPMIPVSLMAQSDGIMGESGVYAQSLDCLHTFFVCGHDLQNTISYSFEHGKTNINVTLSPFADFRSNTPLQPYYSQFVENVKQGIAQGDADIALCLTMLTTGLDQTQAKQIINKENVMIPVEKIQALQHLGLWLLQSSSPASTGLDSMHHTTLSRVLHATRRAMPVDTNRAVLYLLQTRKYCQDWNIDITHSNAAQVTTAALAMCQYASATGLYKYDKLLDTSSTIQLNDTMIYGLNKECDVQHASTDPMATHAENVLKILRCDANKAKICDDIAVALLGKGDCEEMGGNKDKLIADVQSLHEMPIETLRQRVHWLLTQQQYVPCASEVESITKECQIIAQIVHENMNVSTCIGLAGAANLQSDNNVESTCPKTLATYLQTGTGHCWAMLKGVCDKSKTILHLASNCLIRVSKYTGDFTCIEGTSSALTVPPGSLQDKVVFNSKMECSDKVQSQSTAKLHASLLKLDGKFMPQYMAVSLASTIHQTAISNAYDVNGQPVATQLPWGGFYKAGIANGKDILMQAPENAFQKLCADNSDKGIYKFFQEATLGYIPTNDPSIITLHVSVMPQREAYGEGINVLAQALATRVLHPDERDKYYAEAIKLINLRHGINMPLSPYAVNLMDRDLSFPKSYDALKFVARTDEATVRKMMRDKTIKTYVSIAPFAHLCSL